MYRCMNLTLASVGGFLPTIIKGFGYSNARAQLFTVPPYAVALVFMLLLTSFSDAKQARGIPVMCVFIIGIVGWVILLAVPALHASQSALSARFFACICIVTAGYTNIPLIISWQVSTDRSETQKHQKNRQKTQIPKIPKIPPKKTTNVQSANNPQESQRAAALGFLNSIGQCLSLAAAFLFPSNEGPQYVKGAAINIAFQALGLLIAFAMTMYFRIENKRRNKREGNAGMGAGGPVDVHDQYDLAPGKWYCTFAGC